QAQAGTHLLHCFPLKPGCLDFPVDKSVSSITRSRLEVIPHREGYRAAEQGPGVIKLPYPTGAYVRAGISFRQSDFVGKVVDVELCGPVLTERVLDPCLQ